MKNRVTRSGPKLTTSGDISSGIWCPSKTLSYGPAIEHHHYIIHLVLTFLDLLTLLCLSIQKPCPWEYDDIQTQAEADGNIICFAGIWLNIGQIKGLIWLWCKIKGKAVTKVISIHPEENISVCTKFHGKLPINCWDIWHRTTNVKLLIELNEKFRVHQHH